MVAFSKKAKKATQETPPEVEGFAKKEYKRDTGDNYLFKDIQIEDITSLTKPETVFYDDSDMMVYRAASMVEEKRVSVVHKEDPTLTFDCKNITEFKGRGNKVGESSVLGLYNVDRELQGLEPYTPADFEVTPYQIIQGGCEDKAFETAKIQILRTLKETRLQYQIPKIIPVLGEGDCFRELLDHCRKYKGNRADTLRPLILKRLRKWMVDEVNAINVKDLRHHGEIIECDDYIEIMAAKGAAHYRKHGWYSIGVISKDKDSMNSTKLLINNDRVMGKGKDGGKLKFPKVMHIEATNKCAGDVVLLSKGEGKSKDFKGFGFKFLMYQAFLGIDSADNYSALKHLERGFDFGDVAAYKALKPCTTAKETLQATIDIFAKLLPTGVQYVTHSGKEVDVDTITYMNTYFLTAYMIRKLDDTMDFYKLCAAFKVDTSKIVGNNIPVVKDLAPEQEIRDTYEEVVSQMNAISEVLKGTKGKKSDLVENMEQADKMLEDLWITLGNGLFVEEEL